MDIKVPLYNVLNFLLTGFVFIGCLLLMHPDIVGDFIMSEYYNRITAMSETVLLLCVISIAYEIGFVLNRTGSVIVEPILKKAKIVPFNDDYALYNRKAKEFSIMSVLSREYALSRTSILLFFTLSIIAMISCKLGLMIAFAACVLIFTLSCRKHASKIVKLMGEK